MNTITPLVANFWKATKLSNFPRGESGTSPSASECREFILLKLSHHTEDHILGLGLGTKELKLPIQLSLKKMLYGSSSLFNNQSF
jgi:hypothetical protein